MVYEFSDTSKENPRRMQILQELKPASELSSSSARFVQLVGQAGSGSRRLAFSFLPNVSTAVWISAQWNLYSPLLWKLAEDSKIKLFGVECMDRKKFRILFKELLDSQFFDAWILDGLRLTAAEGFFLHKLIRNFPIQILVLDSQPQSFCKERIHIQLSNRSYKIRWSKGGSPTPEYFKAPSFEIIQAEDPWERARKENTPSLR